MEKGLRLGNAWLLTLLRTKLEGTENLKLDSSPFEEPCFARLLCGFSSPSARKNDATVLELDNNLKRRHLP